VPLAYKPRHGCGLYELRSIAYDSDYAHGKRRRMMLTAAARSGLSAARAALRLAATLGAHALWWLDYNVGGNPRGPGERGER